MPVISALCGTQAQQNRLHCSVALCVMGGVPTPKEKDAIAKPKVAALWFGGIMSATDARQMEMQENAPREACIGTAGLTRYHAPSPRQLHRACCWEQTSGWPAPAGLMTGSLGSQTVAAFLQGRTCDP